jgi:hypothetical protein
MRRAGRAEYFGSFAADTRPFLGHRTSHQEDEERRREHDNGEQPETIEIRQCRCLLVAQILQRLPRQLLRGNRISGLLQEARLRLLKKGLHGRIKRIEGLPVAAYGIAPGVLAGFAAQLRLIVKCASKPRESTSKGRWLCVAFSCRIMFLCRSD